MYDSKQKARWDNKAVMDYAVRMAKEEEKRAIALEMKKEGLPAAQISKFTELTVEEIEKL